jgi:hypothetical protein
MAWAIVGMIVYAIGTAGLPYLIKPIFNDVLPRQQDVSFVACAIVAVFLLKGIGSFVSSYLMAGVGQRVDGIRNAPLPAHPEPVGRVLRPWRHRTAALAHQQRRRPVQQVVSETIVDLARESLAVVGPLGAAVLLRRASDDRLLTGAPLIVYPLIPPSAGAAGRPGAGQEAIEQLAPQHRGIHRPSHCRAFATERHEAEQVQPCRLTSVPAPT